MKKVSFADMHCSMARALDAVGDWWTPLILRDIYLGIGRFDEIVDDLGISRNLLTERLRRLDDIAIVEKKDDERRPGRQIYTLTEMGRDLVPILLALTAWGDRWLAPSAGPPMLIRHHACGHIARAIVACSECGEPISSGGIEILPGPGGADAPGTRVVARRLAGMARSAGANPDP